MRPVKAFAVQLKLQYCANVQGKSIRIPHRYFDYASRKNETPPLFDLGLQSFLRTVCPNTMGIYTVPAYNKITSGQTDKHLSL